MPSDRIANRLGLMAILLAQVGCYSLSQVMSLFVSGDLILLHAYDLGFLSSPSVANVPRITRTER